MNKNTFKGTKKEINALQENSKERLMSAKFLIDKGIYRDSISRSYYAILDSARALLLVNGSFAKTHSGVLTLFNLKFVKTNKVPAKYARIFSDAQKYREEADYKFLEKPTKKEAQDIHKKALEFVKMADKKLDEQLKANPKNILLTTILM